MKTIPYCFLAGATIAFGGPFLVNDPYPKDSKLEKFLVTIDGVTTESMPAKNTNGSSYLKYDLGNLPEGTHTATIKAVNTKGAVSAPAAYSFKKTGSKVEPLTPLRYRSKKEPRREPVQGTSTNSFFAETENPRHRCIPAKIRQNEAQQRRYSVILRSFSQVLSTL